MIEIEMPARLEPITKLNVFKNPPWPSLKGWKRKKDGYVYRSVAITK